MPRIKTLHNSLVLFAGSLTPKSCYQQTVRALSRLCRLLLDGFVLYDDLSSLISYFVMVFISWVLADVGRCMQLTIPCLVLCSDVFQL